MTMFDDNGQSINRLYNAKRLNDRTIDELIGLSKGIIADKNVNLEEADFLRSWMEANAPLCEDRIVNQLYCRIHEMMIDGVLDQDEQIELLGILREFTGESTVENCASFASSFPIDQPLPVVEFPTMTFCLTGKFAYGPRRICQEVILERGGETAGGVSHNIDYLVIGTFSSRDWVHTSYGRKIEKAVEYRDQCGDVSIISEDCWAQAAFGM